MSLVKVVAFKRFVFPSRAGEDEFIFSDDITFVASSVSAGGELLARALDANIVSTSTHVQAFTRISFHSFEGAEAVFTLSTPSSITYS